MPRSTGCPQLEQGSGFGVQPSHSGTSLPSSPTRLNVPKGGAPPGTGDTKYNFVVLGVFFFHIWHFWDNKIDHEIKKVEKI